MWLVILESQQTFGKSSPQSDYISIGDIILDEIKHQSHHAFHHALGQFQLPTVVTEAKEEEAVVRH